jgi:3-hydroxybutyrate dehydrogenase
VQSRHSGADMARPEQIEAMVLEAGNCPDGVAIVANNAGIDFVASMHELPDAKWAQELPVDPSSPSSIGARSSNRPPAALSWYLS